MKNKITLLLVGLIGLSFSVSAQSQQASIKGFVQDQEAQPVSYANVILHSSVDSSITKVAYTDNDGIYRINGLEKGSYWMVISFVGLPDFKSEAFDLKAGEAMDYPSIQMQSASEELGEVTVTAQRPMLEVKPDKTVFNVDGSVNATGNSALELLRKAPGVVIDNNENITMLGRAGVQIYIDGKPSPLSGADLANFLKTVNSSEIDAIELISNPSAKYDASGNAGIINIRLKKDKSLGANGSFNLGATQGIASSYNASVNGNYRNKKLNVFGTYSFNDGENPNEMNLYREQNGVVLDQVTDQGNLWVSNNLKIGADYFLNDKHTLGFMVNGNISDNSSPNSSFTYISTIGSSDIDSILVAESSFDSERQNFNYNLNYVFRDEGTSLNVDLDYGQFRNDGRSFQPNIYKDASGEITLQERIFQNETPTDIDIYTFKLDYERDFMKGKLGAGLKSATVLTDNTFNFFDVLNDTPILNTDRSNQFDYTENVNAAYLNYTRQIDKFGFSLGLRMEQTNSTGDLTSFIPSNNNMVKRSYLDFFPSGGVTYAPNEDHSLQLNFSRRINRPSYQDLNPFENKLDELTFEKGNPFLNPEYATNIKLTHTFKYRFNTSISYSHTTDQITRFVDVSGTKGAFITWLNLADQHNYSIAFSAPITVTEWWSSYTNLTGFHMQNRGDYGGEKIVNLNATAFNLYSQHTFTLPKDWSLELSGWYNSPSIWEGTFEMEAQYSIDAGVQKKFLDGKANLKLAVSDIFRTTPFTGTSQFGALFMQINGNWDSRRVSASLSYRFGNNQVKGSRRRKTGLEDESKRVK